MSTFVSFTTNSAKTKVMFYPFLSNLREIQLSNIHGLGGDANLEKEQTYVCCDLIDTKHSYTSFKHENPWNVKVHQSDLLAIYPSVEYPSLPVRQYETSMPVNELYLNLLDKDGNPLEVTGDIRVDLKLKHSSLMSNHRPPPKWRSTIESIRRYQETARHQMVIASDFISRPSICQILKENFTIVKGYTRNTSDHMAS